MNDVDWNERALETALQEVSSGAAPKPMGARIAAASVGQRRAARRRVERAAKPASRWAVRRAMPLAALLLLGVGVVLAVSWAQRTDRARPVGAPEDPQRYEPVNAAEFEALLGQVRGMRVRQCFYSYQRDGAEIARIDIDQPDAGFVRVEDAATRAETLVVLRAACRRGAVRAAADFVPEMRLVLELHDGRDVHCVIDYGSSVRVIAGRDLPLATNELGALANGPAADSTMRALDALAIAPAGLLDARRGDGQPLISRDHTALRVLGLAPTELLRLGEFTRLRELDLSGSALTLTEAEIETLVETMPRLEELDLRGCLLDEARLMGLIGLPPGAVVHVSADGFSPLQRSNLQRAFGGRLRWGD